jgi:uncharacterized low-complexity protein
MLKPIHSILLALMLGMGFMGLSLNASDMKCGAGKCGAAMSQEMNVKGCASCKDCPNPDCAAKKDPSKPCDCPKDAKGNMKCGAGKCGKAMKEDKTMKCGAGKCGR